MPMRSLQWGYFGPTTDDLDNTTSNLFCMICKLLSLQMTTQGSHSIYCILGRVAWQPTTTPPLKVQILIPGILNLPFFSICFFFCILIFQPREMSGEISVDKFSHLGLIFIVNQFHANKPKSYLDFKNVIRKTQI